jgi:hypothetical protein
MVSLVYMLFASRWPCWSIVISRTIVVLVCLGSQQKKLTDALPRLFSGRELTVFIG